MYGQKTIHNNFIELCSTSGFLKMQNNKLNVIGIQYEITDYTDASFKNEPIQIQCPCTLKLKIFSGSL